MGDDIIFSAKKRKQELKSKGAYHTKKELALIVKDRLETLACGEKIDRVMDICCGSGNLLRVFDDDVNKAGIDIELEFIKYCNANIDGDFICSNALTLYHHNLPGNRGSKYIVGNYPFGLRDKKIAEVFYNMVKADRTFPNCNELRDMPELPSLLDSAFIAKNLQCLSSNGKAVMIFGLGWLYRGAKEQKFREWLVGKGWIKSLEIVEGDFFDDTTIRVGIMCIDMCKEHKDIEMVYGERRTIATYEQIKNNNFNLSLERYLPPSKEQLERDKEGEAFDIEASLEYANNLEIIGLELALKMNKACEIAEELIGNNDRIFRIRTKNEKLIRALEIKIKEWKKLYLPQRQENTKSLFDFD